MRKPKQPRVTEKKPVLKPGDSLPKEIHYLWGKAWRANLPHLHEKTRQYKKFSPGNMAVSIGLDRSRYSQWKTGNQDLKLSRRVTEQLRNLFDCDLSELGRFKESDTAELENIYIELIKYWEKEENDLLNSVANDLSKYLDQINVNLNKEQDVISRIDLGLQVSETQDLSKSNSNDACYEYRGVPSVRSPRTRQVENGAAILYVSATGQGRPGDNNAEFATLLIAALELRPVTYEGKKIYFSATTIEVNQADLRRAQDKNVSIHFTDFDVSRPNTEPLYGQIGNEYDCIVGERNGVVGSERWRINLEGDSRLGEALPISSIQLGQMVVRTDGQNSLKKIECEFQAVGFFTDLELEFHDDEEISAEALAKRSAFDWVLANKNLKGEGEKLVLSSSIVEIAYDEK